jgi:ABC-type molybdate transport system substrate-binding protein
MIAMDAAANVATVKATEVAVLSPNAVRSVVTEIAGAFQRETGHSVRFTFGTTGALEKRVTGGDATDIVIATDVVMEQMAGSGIGCAGHPHRHRAGGHWSRRAGGCTETRHLKR